MMNLPNLLSLARLAVTPFVAWTFLRGHPAIALALFFFAGLTDGLDGYLARRFQWSTPLGAYLDPVADKVLLVGVFLTLGAAGALPDFLVALVIGRDILIVALCAIGYYALGLTDFAPSLWGKLSTTIQIFTALIALAGRAAPSAFFEALSMIGIAATTAGTSVSGLHYLWTAIDRWRDTRKHQLR